MKHVKHPKPMEVFDLDRFSYKAAAKTILAGQPAQKIANMLQYLNVHIYAYILHPFALSHPQWPSCEG